MVLGQFIGLISELEVDCKWVSGFQKQIIDFYSLTLTFS